jgi:DNA-directed RNA polymerase specialized sigma24 family protein
MPRDDESVTTWIDGLKAGDEGAAHDLWQRYFRRLVGLARKILQDSPRRAADEEDVALSAFKSFCHRATLGKFPRLNDRDDLWKILMTITARKAMRLGRRERARRPAGGQTDFAPEQVLAEEPSPEFATLVADQLDHLFAVLEDDTLRKTALLKLQGHLNREIADQFDRSVSYVERKLQLIRRIWSEQIPGD